MYFSSENALKKQIIIEIKKNVTTLFIAFVTDFKLFSYVYSGIILKNCLFCIKARDMNFQ